MERWKSGRVKNCRRIEKWEDGKMEKWRHGKKKSLNKFTHITLLKNDAKLKKVTNNHTNKSNHPKFFIKIKNMFQKISHQVKIKINYHAQALKNQKKKKIRKKREAMLMPKKKKKKKVTTGNMIAQKKKRRQCYCPRKRQKCNLN